MIWSHFGIFALKETTWKLSLSSAYPISSISINKAVISSFIPYPPEWWRKSCADYWRRNERGTQGHMEMAHLRDHPGSGPLGNSNNSFRI